MDKTIREHDQFGVLSYEEMKPGVRYDAIGPKGERRVVVIKDFPPKEISKVSGGGKLYRYAIRHSRHIAWYCDLQQTASTDAFATLIGDYLLTVRKFSKIDHRWGWRLTNLRTKYGRFGEAHSRAEAQDDAEGFYFAEILRKIEERERN